MASVSIPGAAAAAPTPRACYHCGEALPAQARWKQRVGGQEVVLCCPGCAAAAALICGGALADYYRQRDGYSPRPSAGTRPDDFAIYDDPVVAARYVRDDGDLRAAHLTVGGLRCSACAWLIETHLAHLPGVLDAAMDYSAQRLHLRWDPARSSLATALAELATLGYPARPFTPDALREQRAQEAHRLLLELGIAALFGMQVMMIAFAFYLGDGLEPRLAAFLRWVSLVLTVPVMGYSARPFFAGARRALARGGVGMDVPIAAALLLAFAGSAWHTWTGTGAVYFDSIVMVVALLGASRYLELAARVRAGRELDRLVALVPDAACRIVDAGGVERQEIIASMRLAPGDTILVRAGDVVPADGCVTRGESSVEEAILTGEATPRACAVGSRVLGGSVNLDGPLQVRVEAVAEQTYAGRLAALITRAAGARPAWAALSERTAAWFGWAVLGIAAATWTGWSLIAPAQAFAATLAVLVVACPCALALAVPTAQITAHASLCGRGVAVTGEGALERLAAVTHVVFDQTGTLTRGAPGPCALEPRAPANAERLLATAFALAQISTHPLSRALRAVPGGARTAPLAAARARAGRGVSGEIDGVHAALGSAAFIAECVPDFTAPPPDARAEVWVALGDAVLGRITFDDALREECATLFASLQARGLACLILSGDRKDRVADLGRRLGALRALGELSPADKLAQLAALQADGAVVAMVGDGVNDAPVLAAADVSIAVASAAGAAREQADVLLLGQDLRALDGLFGMAARARRVMRENLAWAVLYNVIALPIAAAGWLTPWLAALGMSLSSLVVVANAARLRRVPREERAWT